MIWQTDEPQIATWLMNAVNRGGGFAPTRRNYPIVRPALLQLVAKYPEYSKEKN